MIKVILNGEVVEKKASITAADIKKIAAEKGLSRFIVKDEAGNLLKPADFPVEGDMVLFIEPYNEAG